MPLLVNGDSNVTISIELVDNDKVDIDITRSAYQNWVPFDFSLTVEEIMMIIYY